MCKEYVDGEDDQRAMPKVRRSNGLQVKTRLETDFDHGSTWLQVTDCRCDHVGSTVGVRWTTDDLLQRPGREHQAKKRSCHRTPTVLSPMT